MSAPTSRSTREMAPSAPVFSYAQAAKGRSPSLSAAARSSKPNLESTETTPKASSHHESEVGGNGTKEHEIGANHTISEEANSRAPPQHSNSQPDASHEADAHLLASQPHAENTAQSTTVGPESPDYGSTSTSTLPKEDDVFATPNGSSDSTWDKISQVSQNEEKHDGKAEPDDEDQKLSAWEHITVSSQLKEAPPPAFNVWQKRAMDAQAKVSKEPKTPQASSATSQKVEPRPTRKAQEIVPDIGKSDPKKKGKTSPQTADKKTSPLPGKDIAKPVDGKPRHVDDASDIPYRASRSVDGPKPATVAPPPPPGDAISWPTPESAKEEEKKKAQDRSEKGDKEKPTTTKPHGKEKWVAVPYVPSAVFNTPLPIGRRGGRTNRGGRNGGIRGGHSVHGSIGGEEKPFNTISGPASVSTTPLGDRSRGDMGPPKPGPLPPKAKRAASAGPPVSREGRKATDSFTEKSDDSSTGGMRSVQSSQQSSADGRRTSTATQTESTQNGRQSSPPDGRNDSLKSKKPSQNGAESAQQNGSQDHAHPRSNPDRKSDGSMRPPENFRETNGFPYSRERGESRSERGRGGFRGRGGHTGFNGNSLNGQSFSNGQSNHQAPLNFTPSKSQSYSEQGHGLQQQIPPFAAPRETRHFRTGSRSQSIPNPPVYGRFQSGGPPIAAQTLPALQTDVANMFGYLPGHPGIMSAMPYHPFMEQMQLLGMVQMQMEYYFSLDNLCKDMFLRKHMDSQGFVLLSVLMNFNRIKQLSTDIELIRYVCFRSPTMELQTGVDGMDRVRKAEDWQPWVLSMEERDVTAQNEGPVLMQPPQYPQFAQWEGYRGPAPASAISPRAVSSAGPQYRMDQPPYQVPGGIPMPPAVEKLSNGPISDAQITHTPLSAAVPDFTMPSSHNRHPSLTSDSQVASENVFSDEQVENLMIVIRKPTSGAAPSRGPFSSTQSRTFSNGSIDGRTIAEELSSRGDQQAASSVNGDHTPESHDVDNSHRSRSPFTFGSAPRQPTNTAPPVFWVKDKDTPVDDLPNDLTYDSYVIFKQKALQQREQYAKSQCHPDMEILYQFWSHFLVRNFNIRMYEEFRHLAFEDSTLRDSTVGLRNLITYYDESVLGQKTITDDLARDYVDLVKTEVGKNERLAFDKLRAAWRNGAFPLKNRVKIDKIIDADLKSELDG